MRLKKKLGVTLQSLQLTVNENSPILSHNSNLSLREEIESTGHKNNSLEQLGLYQRVSRTRSSIPRAIKPPTKDTAKASMSFLNLPWFLPPILRSNDNDPALRSPTRSTVWQPQQTEERDEQVSTTADYIQVPIRHEPHTPE